MTLARPDQLQSHHRDRGPIPTLKKFLTGFTTEQNVEGARIALMEVQSKQEMDQEAIADSINPEWRLRKDCDPNISDDAPGLNDASNQTSNRQLPLHARFAGHTTIQTRIYRKIVAKKTNSYPNVLDTFNQIKDIEEHEPTSLQVPIIDYENAPA